MIDGSVGMAATRVLDPDGTAAQPRYGWWMLQDGNSFMKAGHEAILLIGNGQEVVMLDDD